MHKPQSIDDELVIFIHKISRSVRESAKEVSASYELSMLQMQALWEIAQGALTMTELSHALFIKLPTTTSLVERLLHMGFVERIPQKDDRRVVAIYITKKGQTVLQQTMDLKTQKFKKMLATLPSADKQELYRILQILYTHI